VDAYSQTLWQLRERLELAVSFQAMEVERRLATNPPTPTKVYYSENYRSGSGVPVDLVSSPPYFRLLPGGGRQPLEVSYSTQVFELAPGVSRKAVMADVARLSTMTPIYERLSRTLGPSVLWYYTSLKNGLHSVFPGHGSISPSLDARNQPWYQAAFGPGHWSEEYADPETRRTVLAVTSPLKRPDGAIAGVTALVIPVHSYLQHRLLVDNIPPETECVLAALATRPESGDKGIRVTAALITSRERGDKDIRAPAPPEGGKSLKSWKTQITPEWLSSSDREQFRAMIEDFEKGATDNILRMPYEGRDSLWVYGPPIGRSSRLVLITPYEEILEPVGRAERYIDRLIRELFTLTGFGLAGTVLVVILLAFSFSRTVTRPLELLSNGMKRLGGGDFDTRVDIRSRDEFGDMGRVFNGLGPQLKDHYAVRQSLALAREVQQHLIPETDPVVQQLDIAGSVNYCDETGGDYYDYFEVESLTAGRKNLAIAVGDVSDHGIPSALLMTTARALLRQRATMGGGTGEIVSDVNRQLARDVGETGRFITLFYAEIDPLEKQISWVRAGHDPAILYDLSRDHFDELAGVGLPLGVSETYRYEDLRRDLSGNQIILIGSDGIWETQDRHGETFGKERVRAIMKDHASRPAREILAALLAKLDSFRGPLKSQDDVTCVIIKVGG
jgi:sigma-B regulation protein RsbU (phosphoserine phosphatase)